MVGCRRARTSAAPGVLSVYSQKDGRGSITPGTATSIRNAVLVPPFTLTEENMVRDKAPAGQFVDRIRPNLTVHPVYAVGETAHHIFPSQAGTVRCEQHERIHVVFIESHGERAKARW